MPMADLDAMSPPSVLPDISPSRGEIGGFAAPAKLSALTIGEIVKAGVISPLEGEMSGRTEGGAAKRRVIVSILAAGPFA